MSDLTPGDRVVVEVGRHRGAKAEVVELFNAPTPSGGRVAIVRVRRPRAGDTFLFPTDVRLASDAPTPKAELPVGFGASGFDG